MNEKERETCEFEMDFKKSGPFFGGEGRSDQSNVDTIS